MYKRNVSCFILIPHQNNDIAKKNNNRIMSYLLALFSTTKELSNGLFLPKSTNLF